MEKERNLHESSASNTSPSQLSSPTQVCVSDSSRDSSSFTLALLQQLSGSFHSDATQTPLIVFFVISSCFLSKSKPPSLTSAPTHLQNRHQLQLCSDFSLALVLSTRFPPWLLGQIGANTGSALIWLWVDFGPDFILALSQLSTSSGSASSLLLNLKLEPVLCPIPNASKTLFLSCIVNTYAANYMSIFSHVGSMQRAMIVTDRPMSMLLCQSVGLPLWSRLK